jgi:hypothetical protein
MHYLCAGPKTTSLAQLILPDRPSSQIGLNALLLACTCADGWVSVSVPPRALRHLPVGPARQSHATTGCAPRAHDHYAVGPWSQPAHPPLPALDGWGPHVRFFPPLSRWPLQRLPILTEIRVGDPLKACSVIFNPYGLKRLIRIRGDLALLVIETPLIPLIHMDWGRTNPQSGIKPSGVSAAPATSRRAHRAATVGGGDIIPCAATVALLVLVRRHPTSPWNLQHCLGAMEGRPRAPPGSMGTITTTNSTKEAAWLGQFIAGD